MTGKALGCAGIGPAIAHARKPYSARRLALAVVGLFRLSKPWLVTPEIVQAINAIAPAR